VEPEVLLLCSQKPTTYIYPEPKSTNPRPLTLFP